MGSDEDAEPDSDDNASFASVDGFDGEFIIDFVMTLLLTVLKRKAGIIFWNSQNSLKETLSFINIYRRTIRNS